METQESKIDINKLRAECSPELDEFYSHTHSAVQILREAFRKSLKRNSGGAD
jgi:hypothetical protein